MRAKCIPEKIEAGAGVLQAPIIVFAVDDLCLLPMQLRSAFGKTRLQRGLELFSLLLGPAVAQRIVGPELLKTAVAAERIQFTGWATLPLHSKTGMFVLPSL